MLKIDGSQGEGGGQIVRSSIALAMVTGQPFQIDNIRAGRKKPGLMRQHLTAVTAAARICGAELAGASIGSARLAFQPGSVTAGEYEFSVGSAGSATLVLQTVLPALMIAGGPSSLVLEGGTHNPHAPPFDFLDRAFLPILNRLGVTVTATLDRPGFYPAGGGRISVHVSPADKFQKLELLERGELLAQRGRAIVANLPRHIGERECQLLRMRTGWPKSCVTLESPADSRGPGNVVVLEIESRHVTEVFTGFGERGVRAEAVADAAWRQASRYLATDVPVGEHLADQLMLPLGVSVFRGGPGGEYRTFALTPHSTTHLDVLRLFLDLDVAVLDHDRDACTVRIGRR